MPAALCRSLRRTHRRFLRADDSSAAAVPRSFARRDSGSRTWLLAVSSVYPSNVSCCVPSRSPFSGCRDSPSRSYSFFTKPKPSAASAFDTGRRPGAAAPWSSTYPIYWKPYCRKLSSTGLITFFHAQGARDRPNGMVMGSQVTPSMATVT